MFKLKRGRQQEGEGSGDEGHDETSRGKVRGPPGRPRHLQTGNSATGGHSHGRRPADQGETLLRVVGVRGRPVQDQVPPRGPGLAWKCSAAPERSDAGGRVPGVSQALECHPVRLLHARRRKRVHHRVGGFNLMSNGF